MRMLDRRTLWSGVLIMCVAVTLVGGSAAQAAPTGFSLMVTSADGEQLVDMSLPAAAGWVFGDRLAYSCAYFYLSQGGANVARITMERTGAYEARINDKFGHQSQNTTCGTPATPLTFGGPPVPLIINATTFTLGGLVSDATWATGGCSNGSPYDYLIYDGAPILKVTVESLGATVGPCPLPVIASFSPTSGSFGTAIVIQGTDLAGVTGVAFDGVVAQHVSLDSTTQITASLPDGATSGLVSVTAPDGTVSGTGTFTVTHEATLTLRLRQSAGGFIASGSVGIPDGTSSCAVGRRVVIEHKVNGSWHRQGAAVTHPDGSFRYGVSAVRRGWVRASLKQTRLSLGDICQPAQDTAHTS